MFCMLCDEMFWRMRKDPGKVAPWSTVFTLTYVLAEMRPRKYKCGLSAPCPPKHLAFRLVSGSANVIGPKICLEDKMWDSESCRFLCVSPLLPHVPFFFLIHLSYCCHNPIPMSARRTKCKYLSLSFLLSFSLSSLLLCCSPWNLFYPVHQCAFAWQTGILLKLISLRRFNKQNCSLRLTNVYCD